MRPGRIDRHIFVDLPDLGERIQILQIQARRMPFEAEEICSEIAELTSGYSAAELVAICQRAGIFGLEENINCQMVSFLCPFIFPDNSETFCCRP